MNDPINDDSVEVRFCVDCVFADANGADDEGISEDWTGFLPEWDGWVFGRLALTEELEPAEPHFVNWGSRCDGCGSPLGGDRYDYIAVRVRDRHDKRVARATQEGE